MWNKTKDDMEYGSHVPFYQMRPESSEVEPKEGSLRIIGNLQLLNLKTGEYNGK
jgi:hypothetical protein